MNIFLILKIFNETLHGKNSFYSWLSGKRISDRKYQHVLKVWNKTEMKTMKDYYDFYLKYDVLFLAEVFEIFRNRYSESYGFCPSHYLSAPALSWGAMFSMTKVEVDLISDGYGRRSFLYFQKIDKQIINI